MRSLFFILLLVIALTAVAQDRNGGGGKTVLIVFHNMVGKQPLVLNDSVKIASGETITVERFRYYVSNFVIRDEKGTNIALPAAYFLVDEEDPGSRSIRITVPAGKFTQLSFLLGVDSIRNVSGIQTGALDPMKGMFWTWNSGYVMAKLEGTSPVVEAAGNRFTYHIGGFRTGMNVLKQIHLELPAAEKDIQEIHINADINHWFKGASDLKISETPVCHSPGALAVRIANNYSSMFSINSVR